MSPSFTRISAGFTRQTQLFVVSLAFTFTSFSQTAVKGKVIDSSTKEPLEMVVLTDSATAKNAMTDKTGNFQLKQLSSGQSTIVVTMIGYKSQRVTIVAGKAAFLNIALQKGPVDLREVTITGTSGGVVGAFHTLSKIDLNMASLFRP